MRGSLLSRYGFIGAAGRSVLLPFRSFCSRPASHLRSQRGAVRWLGSQVVRRAVPGNQMRELIYRTGTVDGICGKVNKYVHNINVRYITIDSMMTGIRAFSDTLAKIVATFLLIM